MKIYCLYFFLLLCPGILVGQNWVGTWSGEVTQNGKPDKYIYTIQLEQDGQKVFGTSTSQNPNGGGNAKFEIGGIWDGSTLTLQEVKQIEPPNARWCLKHIRLTPAQEDGATMLKGTWEAQGCTPGGIVLSWQSAVGNSQPSVLSEQEYHQSTISNQPSSIAGRYSGTLSQSDRDYGFYFEIQLEADGTGTSTITSDGEGGNATHRLRWAFDENSNEIQLTEERVIEKSVANWPWCIKKAVLEYHEDENRLSLTGNWQGFIEGYGFDSGPCAPGQIYLERPIFKKDELVQVKAITGEKPPPPIPQGVLQYKQKQQREVEVDRVLEVKKSTVRIRVWDSGTIDGDVVTLFVNGEKILENFRVTRRKYETIVKLDKPTNYLILHAINLGTISPNTVAVSVDDGYEEQVVIMSSNLSKSGAIMIRQFEVGN